MGKVISQKVSQPVAPSMLHASYRAGEMLLNPARKMKIWMPELLMTS